MLFEGYEALELGWSSNFLMIPFARHGCREKSESCRDVMRARGDERERVETRDEVQLADQVQDQRRMVRVASDGESGCWIDGSGSSRGWRKVGRV
jgi:hypothetical protein